MCGITGFAILSQRNRVNNPAQVVFNMSNALFHRGPDDGGVWCDPNHSVFFGHRRLAIIDLSIQGHQPMLSPSHRYVIVFNGEIYNHKLLRKSLEKSGHNIRWKGCSDTETLLACIEVWGLKQTIKKCIGMFSIALFDQRERAIYLVRDRMGEKPLYYGIQSGVFLFGSELKSLRKNPMFRGEIDRNSIACQFSHGYVASPNTIYKDIKKLPAGTILKTCLKDCTDSVSSLKDPIPYWSLKDVVENAKINPYAGSSAEAVNDLECVLSKTIERQMISDAPLGAFLSGGIDSSLVVSLMQSQSDIPIETFSVGFTELGYNEADHSKRVANYLGTKHTEVYVSEKEAMDIIPDLSSFYDEPFSDSSQIPTYLISSIAKKSVDVSLSGDAGDELFGGYNRYLWTGKIWNKIKLMSPTLRRLVGRIILSTPPATWEVLLRHISSVSLPGDKMHKIANALPSNSVEGFYFSLISHWQDSNNIVLGSAPQDFTALKIEKEIDFGDIEHKMMYLDAINYLPDDILVKVDRAAMGASLETRVPFLDHNVVEFAYRLPMSMKIKNGEGKWILRQLLDRHVPRELIDRPKMGFGVPIESWLRGGMRDWAESLLNKNRLEQEGFLNAGPIRRKWQEHLSGKRNWQHHLWDVLMFQSWLEKYK